MPITVDFRIVGLFAHFPELFLPNLTDASTVKDIMDEVRVLHPNFSYVGTRGSYLKDPTVIEISFITEKSSQASQSRNTKYTPGAWSILSTVTTDPTTVWRYSQYYILEKDGRELVVDNSVMDQPSYAIAKIGEGREKLEGWVFKKYRLIWQLVVVDLASKTT
ncbi:MAG: hypothetical protein AB8B51_03995 [Sedimentitalea sp.]